MHKLDLHIHLSHLSQILSLLSYTLSLLTQKIIMQTVRSHQRDASLYLTRKSIGLHKNVESLLTSLARENLFFLL